MARFDSGKKVFTNAFLITLLASLAVLLPRFGSGYLPENYLWAEDGQIFMTQANQMGLHSFWVEHAGYLHLYPRLVAYFAAFFRIEMQPVILFSGWLLSFGVMVYTLVLAGRRYGLGFFSLLGLSVLIVCQPNNGDVFFNITNSQWLLGLALTLYVFSFQPARERFFVAGVKSVLLAVVSLTGVYSIVIAPVLFFRSLLVRQLKENALLLVILSGGALVQVFVLLSSERMTTLGEAADLTAWLLAFRALLFFGSDRPLTLSLAALFWCFYIAALVKRYRHPEAPDAAAGQAAFLFLLLAAFYAAVELYAGRALPHLYFPTAGGRYNWIPNALIFFSAFLASSGLRVARFFIFCSLTLICVLNFHQVVLQDFQPRSFFNFARYHEVTIPVNPQMYGVVPCCSISGVKPDRTEKVAAAVKIIDFDFNAFFSHGLEAKREGDQLRIQSTTKDPYLLFDEPFRCEAAADVGVEIEMTRKERGNIQLFWSTGREMTETQSVRRAYSAGEIRAHFAFRNQAGPVYLRLDPLEAPGEIVLRKMTVFCLPPLSPFL